jgi:hypothetical protein
MAGVATVTPTGPLANYKGTRLDMIAGSALTASSAAQWQAQALISGDSTFTTWVIFLSSGTLTGAGTITASTIRVLLASGTLPGAGTLIEPVPQAGIVGTSSFSATAKVNRGVAAGIAVGATFDATSSLQVGVAASIAGTSYLLPPYTAVGAIVAGSSVSASAFVTKNASMSAVAGSSATAYGTPVRGVAASISADSSQVTSAQATRGVRAVIVGGATVSPSAIAHYVASAHILGNSFLPPPDLVEVAAAISAGSSVLATADVQHIIHAPGVVQTLILGARLTGAGTIADSLLRLASGILTGAGGIAATPYLILSARPIPMVGSGGLHDSTPLPMVGIGNLTGFFEVIRVPRPYCPPPVQPTFRYGYTLGRGDLELHICDTTGNPYGPVVVFYAFYQIVRGGQRMLVGPPNRRPAPDMSQGKPGRYYATGTAGELGQPGEWVIVWRWQRSWWTPTEFFEQHFKVVDEVTSGAPGALNGRCIKYGWL